MNVVVAGRVSTVSDVMVVVWGWVWVVPDGVDVVDVVCAAALDAMTTVIAAAINTRFNIRTSASNSH
jgi:hypothetical protein